YPLTRVLKSSLAVTMKLLFNSLVFSAIALLGLSMAKPLPDPNPGDCHTCCKVAPAIGKGAEDCGS
ncbi:hypothetical protein FRC12_017935, partial [Ceratobasidium sp. 428]